MSACTASCDSLLAQLTAWGPVLRHAADVQIVGEAPLELLEVSEITAAGLAALRGLQKHLRSAAQPPENGLFLVNPHRLPDAADLVAVTAAVTALVAKGPGGAHTASLDLAVPQELKSGHFAYNNESGHTSYGLYAKVCGDPASDCSSGAHPETCALSHFLPSQVDLPAFQPVCVYEGALLQRPPGLSPPRADPSRLARSSLQAAS